MNQSFHNKEFLLHMQQKSLSTTVASVRQDVLFAKYHYTKYHF